MCNECKMTVYTNPQYESGGENGRLFNCEHESDVTFVAGIDEDTWRIPGHRHVLATRNRVFQAMLYGPLSNGEDVILVKDVDKRAFEQLLKYLYEEKVVFQSLTTARATLEAAHKYLCPELVERCVKYLDQELTPSTVLYVFQNLRFFCNKIPQPTNTPTAPPLNAISDQPGAMSPEESMTEYCNSLLHNCLLFIDENADAVLQQEYIEELSYEDISIIALRDTLNVTCEMELFRALNRWCKSECKRNKKELTPANRRQVLGELSYSVRYLLMTEYEFIQGPQASELLDLTECRLILARKRKEPLDLTREQEEMLKKFETPRFYNVHVQPICLSERSQMRYPKPSEKSASGKKDLKKKKKKKRRCCGSKKEFMDDVESDDEKGCSCTCCIEGMFRALVCIFD